MTTLKCLSQLLLALQGTIATLLTAMLVPCQIDSLLHTWRAIDVLKLHAMKLMHSKEVVLVVLWRHLYTKSASMLMQWRSMLPATVFQEHGKQQACPGCQILDLFHGACLLWLGPGSLRRMATQICQWRRLTCTAVQKVVCLPFQNTPL